MLKDITTLFIRLFAAYLVFSTSITILRQLGYRFLNDPSEQASINQYFLLSFIIALLAAALLWHFAPRLANLLTRNLQLNLELPHPEGLVMAGSFLIGAYWVLDKLAAAAGIIVHYVTYDPPFMGELRGFDAALKYWTDGYEITTFFVAILMMVGCKQVGLLFRRLRTLGGQNYD
jgi:hypothetical protein